MKRLITFGSVSLFLITLLGIYFFYNITSFVRRGIDLVGGTMITLHVDTDKVFAHVLSHDIAEVKRIARDHNITISGTEKIEGDLYACTYSNKDDAQKCINVVKDSDLKKLLSLKDNKILVRLDEAEKKRVIDNAVNSNIKVLRDRLDPYGAGEMLIAPQGDKIVIELPNVQNPEEARQLIGKSAILSIKEVIDAGATRETLLNTYGGETPYGTIALQDESNRMWYLLPEEDSLTGHYIKDAYLGYDQNKGNAPAVQFTFNRAGGAKFHTLTKENIGKPVAIVLDDTVISAPVVQSEIPHSGQAVTITGKFTPEEAQRLATMLKSGSFIAPVKIGEERIIGPSLGQEAIKKGFFACLIGLALLLTASLIFYKTSGLLAFMALIYNLLFTLMGMSLIGATLTLPGIAGLILTLGMAVDASILIYEKIRDELKTGISFKGAVESGFSGMMSVILDANITHFIVAIVLYKFGSGPLQGFAITMIIGIISTLISGIFLLRGFFSYLLRSIGFAKIKI